VDIPPVLVDGADQLDVAVLPPAATRQLLDYFQYAWVGVRLDDGAAGIPRLQQRVAALASSVRGQVFRATHQQQPGLTFDVSRSDVIRSQVQQAIRPQAVALEVFGALAALAMLVLAGQGLAQLLSRSAQDMTA
jgi:hypothetical protein